jgi:hypothetical protein
MPLGSFALLPLLVITRPQKHTTSKRHNAIHIIPVWLSCFLFYSLLCGLFGPIKTHLVGAGLLTAAMECGLSINLAYICSLPMMHFTTIILISNILSVAFLHFILATGFHIYEPLLLIIGELIVWIFEGSVLYILGKWTLKLSLKDAFLISLINNAFSLVGGFLLLK